MDSRNKIKRKAVIIPFIIVLSLVFIYTALSLLVLDDDPILGTLGRLTDTYLLFHQGMANKLLHWSGSAVQVKDHLVMLDGEAYEPVRSGTLMRKWMVLLLLMAWVFPAGLREKLFFSGLVLLLNFMMSPLTIALQALLNIQGTDLGSHTRISRTAAHLMNLTLLFVWLGKRREALWKFLSRLRLDSGLLKQKSVTIVFLCYLYLILGYFMLGWFEFTPWVDFLLNTSSKVLSWFSIESVVESQVMIGERGSLSMLKSCLGLNTMLLFASLVFVMGGNNLTTWAYIISGLIILNIANVMRLVLLFMHVHKHGTYVGVVDYHDLYDYIIYGLVFILWVIWFEKFSQVSIMKRKESLSR